MTYRYTSPLSSQSPSLSPTDKLKRGGKREGTPEKSTTPSQDALPEEGAGADKKPVLMNDEIRALQIKPENLEQVSGVFVCEFWDVFLIGFCALSNLLFWASDLKGVRLSQMLQQSIKFIVLLSFCRTLFNVHCNEIIMMLILMSVHVA